MQWCSVVGWEGIYEVSSHGDLRSVNRVSHLVSSAGKKYTKQLFGKLLTKQVDKDGYITYAGRYNGKRKHLKAHRCVAEAFLDNIDGSNLVDHKNRIRSDNRVENLQWITPKDNSKSKSYKSYVFNDVDGNVVFTTDLSLYCSENGIQYSRLNWVLLGNYKSAGGCTRLGG